jgi:hypothetical protein
METERITKMTKSVNLLMTFFGYQVVLTALFDRLNQTDRITKKFFSAILQLEK